MADKGGARQDEAATRVTRRSYEVVLNVRDKTNDGALFCLQVRLEGAQSSAWPARGMRMVPPSPSRSESECRERILNWVTSGHNGSPIALGGAENITTWWWLWTLACRESRVEGQIRTGTVRPRNAPGRRVLTTRKLLKTLCIESSWSPLSRRRRVLPPASCGVMDATEISGIGLAAQNVG